MQLSLNPNMTTSVYQPGEEKSPLLVVDNFLQDAERLVEHACQQQFVKNSPFYPGIRAPAPIGFQSLLLGTFGQQLQQVFELKGSKLALSLCQYSLVTMPADQLTLLQRIPHFDSTKHDELAAVFYLFREDLGGTAFYRHRRTGFEYIDESRKVEYFRSLEAENDGPNMPEAGYINGHTPLYEQIACQEGVFNRMLIYKRNSLHSGCIPEGFIPDTNPATGRLSINSFIDVL